MLLPVQRDSNSLAWAERKATHGPYSYPISPSVNVSIGLRGGLWNLTYLIWTRGDQAPSTHTHGRLWKGTSIYKICLIRLIFLASLNPCLRRGDFSHRHSENLSHISWKTYQARRQLLILEKPTSATVQTRPVSTTLAFSTSPPPNLRGVENKVETKKKNLFNRAEEYCALCLSGCFFCCCRCFILNERSYA